MASPVVSPLLKLLAGSAADCDTDLLVVPVFEGEAPADALPWLDQGTGGEVKPGDGFG